MRAGKKVDFENKKGNFKVENFTINVDKKPFLVEKSRNILTISDN